MSYADEVQGFMISLAKILGMAQVEKLGDKDIHKLVDLCRSNGVAPYTIHGALFGFFIMIFDKEIPIDPEDPSRQNLIAISKQFANMTLGMSTGLTIQLSKAIEDAILDTVEWNKLSPDVAAVLLADGEMKTFLLGMVGRAVRSVREAEGKDQ